MPRAAQTLYQSCLSQSLSERFAGILASAVTVKDRSFYLFSVLRFQFIYGSNAQLLLHIVVHGDRKNCSIKGSFPKTVEKQKRIWYNVLGDENENV